jgi:hypothetical protein
VISNTRRGGGSRTYAYEVIRGLELGGLPDMEMRWSRLL